MFACYACPSSLVLSLILLTLCTAIAILPLLHLQEAHAEPGAAFTISLSGSDSDSSHLVHCHHHLTPPVRLQKAHAKSGAAFTIGVVGRCLSKSVVEGKYLGEQCKELVMAAAPRDVRAYYSTPEASNAFLQTVREQARQRVHEAYLSACDLGGP
eukprot:scaffold251669_cov18-Tisochrysis_lutea.AAC.1